MDESVRSEQQVNRVRAPFLHVAVEILAILAVFLFGAGIIGYWGMHESNNPIYPALLDGSFVSLLVLFATILIICFFGRSKRK